MINSVKNARCCESMMSDYERKINYIIKKRRVVVEKSGFMPNDFLEVSVVQKSK